MIWGDLFQQPEALGLLLVAPLVWCLLVFRDRTRRRRLRNLVGPRADVLTDELGAGRRSLRRGLFALGLLLALLAALGPMWGAASGELTWRGVDIVVCLDVSRSMLARDVDPDRLSRARREIRSLAARAEGDRLGLVAFAGEARRVVPLTPDGATFAQLASAVEPSDLRRGGTDLGAALEAALDVLEGGLQGDARVVVLLTDGEDHEGRGASLAERFRRRGIPVHAVGLGTRLGAKIPVAAEGAPVRRFLQDRAGREVVSALDTEALRHLAEGTGGVFVDGGAEQGALVPLYEDRILPMARITQQTQERRSREDRYQWPLMAALALWMLTFSLTDRTRS